MKKILFAGLALICAATPALAIGRYNSLNYDCSEIKSIIAREGAVIFQYPGHRGNPLLYNRYVRGNFFCVASGSYAARAWIPSKDTSECPVLECKSASDYIGNGY